MNRTRLAALAAITLLLPACSERTTAALVDGEGLLASGSKFGVNIGDTLPVATASLVKQGLIAGTIEPGGRCMSPKTFPAERTAYFIDMTWRSGNICLGLTKGKVSHIAWLYNPLNS